MQDSKRTREMQLSVRETLASKKQESRRDSEAENSDLPQYSDSDDDETNFDARMRQQILRKRTELGDAPSHQKSKNGDLNILYILLYNFFLEGGILLCNLLVSMWNYDPLISHNFRITCVFLFSKN